ncbi:hypothetical protein J6590_053613 [Homalodisca vitripennis]|nr:hypothetical protein J6590_053613 [Homalodisca vitripennis]
MSDIMPRRRGDIRRAMMCAGPGRVLERARFCWQTPSGLQLFANCIERVGLYLFRNFIGYFIPPHQPGLTHFARLSLRLTWLKAIHETNKLSVEVTDTVIAATEFTAK